MNAPPNDERRPGETGAASTSWRDTARVDQPADFMSASSPWASRVIAAGRARGVVPTYGGQAWQAMPEDDPRWLAAVAIAAECWQYQGRPEVMAERLRDEVYELGYVTAWRLRMASYAVNGAADWTKLSKRLEPKPPMRSMVFARIVASTERHVVVVCPFCQQRHLHKPPRNADHLTKQAECGGGRYVLVEVSPEADAAWAGTR